MAALQAVCRSVTAGRPAPSSPANSHPVNANGPERSSDHQLAGSNGRGRSLGQPVIEEMAALAVLHRDDPDVGVELDLARQVGVGVRLGRGIAVEAALPTAVLPR